LASKSVPVHGTGIGSLRGAGALQTGERSGTVLLIRFIRSDCFLVQYVKEPTATLDLMLDCGTSRSNHDNFGLVVFHRRSPPLCLDSATV
jgi:hypothetical protein